MEWLQSILNGENGSAFQLVMITLALVVILVLLVWLFRRIVGTPSRRAARNRVPRLSITDVTAVDEKRFLILARRDNVEHLILIGGANDVVVETDIVRTQATKQRGPSPVTTPAVAEAAPETTPATVAATGVVATAAVAGAMATEPKPVEPLVNETADLKVKEDPQPMVETKVELEEPASAPQPAEPVTSPIVEDLAVTEPEAQEAPLLQEDTSSNQDTLVEDDSLEIIELDEPEHNETLITSSDVEENSAADESPSGSVSGESGSDASNEVSLAPDIDAKISEQLDQALNSGGLEIETPDAAAPAPASGASAEDDMQKLLQELAAETR